MFFRKKADFSEDDLNSVIIACEAKNARAQKALIKLFLGYAKSICMHYSGNIQEAEEIMNDGFLKVFNNISKYDHSRPFKLWLRSIFINTALDHYRKNKKHAHHINIDDLEIHDFSHDIISKISAEEILLLVQSLPPSYRMVFVLYVVEGYTHQEIAYMLDIGVGTSKSNLRDARRKLQVMIKNSYPHLYLAHSLKISKFHEN